MDQDTITTVAATTEFDRLLEEARQRGKHFGTIAILDYGDSKQYFYVCKNKTRCGFKGLTGTPKCPVCAKSRASRYYQSKKPRSTSK